MVGISSGPSLHSRAVVFQPSTAPQGQGRGREGGDREHPWARDRSAGAPGALAERLSQVAGQWSYSSSLAG